MIGVLLISHGGLAKAMLDTASEIVGPYEACEALAVSRAEGLDEIETRILLAIERVNQGGGVLLLVDMFGGTAANVALRLLGHYPIEIVASFSLPMLLKLPQHRHLALDELACLMCECGRKHVRIASELFMKRGEHV